MQGARLPGRAPGQAQRPVALPGAADPLQGRTEAQARAARAAKRKAEAVAAAKAKAERESKKWVRPIAGASVAGQTTGADGQATVTFDPNEPQGGPGDGG